jgi:hypothetical protein
MIIFEKRKIEKNKKKDTSNKNKDKFFFPKKEKLKIIHYKIKELFFQKKK